MPRIFPTSARRHLALFCLTLGAALSAGVCRAGPATSAVEVIARYAHDPEAFTQGLIVDDAVLHESTGRYGRSTLREVDLESGRIARVTRLPDAVFAEGLARIGDSLYLLSWHEGTLFVYDRRTLALQRTLPQPGEGWGLASDGTHLIMSDGSSMLRFLDPRTLTVDRTLTVTNAGQPVAQLNELEYVEGRLYANLWRDDRIAIIDPASGKVEHWLDLAAVRATQPGGCEGDRSANGIAYDAGQRRLFITGKCWKWLYEIRAPAIPRAPENATPAAK